MSAATDETAPLPADVEAVLNYMRNTGVRPVNYAFNSPPGVSRTSGVVDAQRVTIRDARRVSGLGLDISGFDLIRHRSTLVDWASFRDPEQVEAVDYPEVAAALKAHVAADKVLIFNHALRDSTATPRQAPLRQPSRMVHNDQTFRSAPELVSMHLAPKEAACRLQRRFAIINFWRPVAGPVMRTPLAVCDGRTIEDGDLFPSDLVYPKRTVEIYAVAFNPNHRWYWYPRQTPAEATLFKIYDSAADGRVRLSAHSAFDDPTGAPDTPPRLSVEVRSLVFW
jgi:hypothetical protein